MTLRLRAKVLLHVWSYDFYDTITATSDDKIYCYLFFLDFWEFSSLIRMVSRQIYQCGYAWDIAISSQTFPGLGTPVLQII